MTTIAYILIFGLLGSLTTSVVWGLYWAIKTGQFANFQRGATSIFDDEEPIGFRTDAFPGEAASASRAGTADRTKGTTSK